MSYWSVRASFLSLILRCLFRVNLHCLRGRWKTFRERISKETSHVFNHLLSKRGHSGGVRFDHHDNKLELDVTMNAALGHTKSIQDTGQLSGGERSFTTIAFVLALGAALQTPFRLMDEFDVFMVSLLPGSPVCDSIRDFRSNADTLLILMF
jgi:hypothetical protein